MTCPNCKSTEYKEARQCPLYKGEPICISCCNNCKFYKEYFCRYYIEKGKDEELKKKELLDKLENQLLLSRKQLEIVKGNELLRLKVIRRIRSLENKKKEITA